MLNILIFFPGWGKSKIKNYLNIIVQNPKVIKIVIQNSLCSWVRVYIYVYTCKYMLIQDFLRLSKHLSFHAIMNRQLLWL